MRRRFLRRAARSTAGTAAVEFAIIGPVFLLLLFAIIETGAVLFAREVLSDGVIQASRQIRTGQAQGTQMTQSEFRQEVCDRVNHLLSCDADRLYIDVRAFTTFGGTSFPPPLDGNGDIDPANTNNFNMGESGNISGGTSIVLVRGFYTWTLFTPMFSQFLSNMAGNQRLLSTSVAFKNEPF
jgi:Flp pilus assembly protein TadG